MKLIVGIDPGITTAIAMISLDAEHCFLLSKKNMKIYEICDFIAEKGKPVIVATDVAKPPATVKKVAAAFNSLLVKPGKNLTQSSKRKLTRSAKSLRNKHEKDALAAAVNARKKFASLFRKVDSALSKRNMLYISEDVKEMLIRRKASNITQAIKLAS